VKPDLAGNDVLHFKNFFDFLGCPGSNTGYFP